MEDRNVEYKVLEDILAGRESPKDLPYSVLENITLNFSKDRKIGQGGFGDVYKGVLPHGIVAVKRIRVSPDTLDDKQFKREFQSSVKINHPNVVRFLGFCCITYKELHREKGSQNDVLVDVRKRLLCFEYISNGSLNKHITDELRGLQWSTRYQIIKGICEGLKYLHQEKEIKHMDLKPANIMVDDDMVPKITDFGLARQDENTDTMGARFGPGRYCAPEYIISGKTSYKCDIYSLGVIIKELVTGFKEDEIPDKDLITVLRRWRCRWRKSSMHTPLQDQQITKCIEIANRCTEEVPGNRPNISDILCNLSEIESMNCHVSADAQVSSYSDDDMLGIEPLELHFAFELNKQTSREIVLSNVANKRVAFKIETVGWKRRLKYCIQPNKGIVQPKSQSVVKITLEAQETTPGYMDHPDEFFVVQSIKVENNDRRTDEDITEHMFNNNEAGEVVDQVNVTVVYCEPNRQEVDQAGPSVLVSEDINSSSYKSVRGQGTKRQRLDFHPMQQTLTDTKGGYPSSDDDGAYLRTGTVDLMTGAMGSLLPKMCQLLKKEHNLPEDVEEDVESLQEELTDLHTALCNVPHEQLHKLDLQDKRWAGKIRELSYDIEDMVDDLLIKIERSEPIINPDIFGSQVKKMLSRVSKVADRSKEVKFSPSLVNQVVTSTDCDPRLPSLYKDHKELVGIDGPRNVLVKWLITSGAGDDTQQLKIISIYGEGGLGKTTLAKAVYDRPAVNFDLQAFVPVGRNPDTMRVLKGILTQLDRRTTFYSDQTQLIIDELRHRLTNKRYLIVIDDIWDETSWDTIKCALVENYNGSRVITTSRIFEIAKRSGEVCKLEPLSDYHSKELFYARLIGKGTHTFDQPDEQSTKYILGKCGGLPLAIITIASLLDGKPMEDWPEVYKSIGFGNEDSRAHNTKKILLFSYLDLPFHLKTCLLYLSIFPEEHVIEKNSLIWKWIAEGFVQRKKGKTLFEVGEGYFNELINRSIIQPAEVTEAWWDNEDLITDNCTIIRACRVHDMVLALICSLARKENFVAILEGDEEQHLSSPNNARILAVHKEPHGLLSNTCRERVTRSFNATKCDLSQMALDSLLPRFEVLRVLSLEDCHTSSEDHHHRVLNNLAGLRHLRYIGLRGSVILELPMEMGDLRFLQVMDLTGTEIKELPQSVTLLRDLKCLHCPDDPVLLPDGMGSLTSLEELRLRLSSCYLYVADFVKELGKLTELRVLHLETTAFSDSLNGDLVVSLNNLKKIQQLEIYDNGDRDYPNIWDGFLPCRLLRHLRLCNSEPPEWINASRLPNISVLDLDVTSVEVGGLDNLGSLRELRCLVLQITSDEWYFHHVIATGAFPKLRYYKTFNLVMTYLPGAMPCLESFEMYIDRRAVVGFDFSSLQYLPLLQKVAVTFVHSDVITEELEPVKAALRHAVDNHDNRPVLVLDRYSLCEDDEGDIDSSDDSMQSPGFKTI